MVSELTIGGVAVGVLAVFVWLTNRMLIWLLTR